MIKKYIHLYTIVKREKVNVNTMKLLKRVFIAYVRF